MRFTVLACDYDNTIAVDGTVDDATVWDLGRVRTSGRRLVLVTGRDLPTLQSVFPHLDLFEFVVAENGGVLYRPADRSDRPLAEAPHDKLVERLTRRGVPLTRGRVAMFTWRPHEIAALEEIAALGLGHQVILNRDAVMILPPGVTKGSGLRHALGELRLSPHNTVAVGDAENDHDLLAFAGCGVAVANAVVGLREHADRVTVSAAPDGVRELIAALIDDDLESWNVEGTPIVLGTSDGDDVTWTPGGAGLLITGSSGSGKSTLVAAMIERLAAAGYQTAVIDPEADFDGVPGAVSIGDSTLAPGTDEIVDLVEAGTEAVVACLLAVPMEDRPKQIRELLAKLTELAQRLGRPHGFIVDEAHHAFSTEAPIDIAALPRGLVVVSNLPERLPRDVLTRVGTVVAVGSGAATVLHDVAGALGSSPPATDRLPGAAIAWRVEHEEVVGFMPAPVRHRRKRHAAKMVAGDVGGGQRLVITGPEDALSLEVRNLSELVRIALGVDDATWLHHARRGDWSEWVRGVIGDTSLAERIADIEHEAANADTAGTALHDAVAAAYPDAEF